MTRFLVTGANGFIGACLLKRLTSSGDHEIHALGRSPGPGLPGVIWHRMDLLEIRDAAKAVRSMRARRLIHLAWNTVPGIYWEAPDNLEWLEASVSLLRAFVDGGGEKATFAGTCAEYGSFQGRCYEVSTPAIPETLYGACKLALWNAVQGDLEIAWARIFHPFGPGERPERLVPGLIRSLLLRRPMEILHGRQEKDFIFVEDVADALIALSRLGPRGVFNVGTGVPVAIDRLALALADRLGGADCLTFRRQEPGDDLPGLVGDIGRIIAETNWRPGVELEAGLERSISFWRTLLHESGIVN